MTTEVNDKIFHDTIADGVTLVDFWAPWCGPCRMQAPAIEAISEEFEDRLKVAKLNVDDNQKTAQEFGVMSIPTLIIFKDGEEVDKVIGLHSEEQLTELVEKHIQ
ncbi:MAG TPA: thioredoxin [Bavariicoccus seileri]|uniref:Thioredoxin n=1 Tax=Bavariicoccus seileri TaxID=549685 RepID=A0A3D4S4B4_9ENTE|nr:thioredoxin [Bavariicoccus seileri]HCS93653.1 thioredoxin [Bavariicoccus seileri]